MKPLTAMRIASYVVWALALAAMVLDPERKWHWLGAQVVVQGAMVFGFAQGTRS